MAAPHPTPPTAASAAPRGTPPAGGPAAFGPPATPTRRCTGAPSGDAGGPPGENPARRALRCAARSALRRSVLRTTSLGEIPRAGGAAAPAARLRRLRRRHRRGLRRRGHWLAGALDGGGAVLPERGAVHLCAGRRDVPWLHRVRRWLGAGRVRRPEARLRALELRGAPLRLLLRPLGAQLCAPALRRALPELARRLGAAPPIRRRRLSRGWAAGLAALRLRPSLRAHALRGRPAAAAAALGHSPHAEYLNLWLAASEPVLRRWCRFAGAGRVRPGQRGVGFAWRCTDRRGVRRGIRRLRLPPRRSPPLCDPRGALLPRALRLLEAGAHRGDSPLHGHWEALRRHWRPRGRTAAGRPEPRWTAAAAAALARERWDPHPALLDFYAGALDGDGSLAVEADGRLTLKLSGDDRRRLEALRRQLGAGRLHSEKPERDVHNLILGGQALLRELLPRLAPRLYGADRRAQLKAAEQALGQPLPGPAAGTPTPEWLVGFASSDGTISLGATVCAPKGKAEGAEPYLRFYATVKISNADRGRLERAAAAFRAAATQRGWPEVRGGQILRIPERPRGDKTHGEWVLSRAPDVDAFAALYLDTTEALGLTTAKDRRFRALPTLRELHRRDAPAYRPDHPRFGAFVRFVDGVWRHRWKPGAPERPHRAYEVWRALRSALEQRSAPEEPPLPRLRLTATRAQTAAARARRERASVRGSRRRRRRLGQRPRQRNFRPIARPRRR